ncbi:hypothetical protein AB0L13_37180 [Saccharopolyspora shandongensis]|uniref:hypothetical protein n=1 Tax=Saccharopolyspora shandongensis TaxID=418495 RepID=UPI00342947DB
MDPEAGERVAKVYENKAEKVWDVSRRTDRLVGKDAFGNCFIGRDLEQKFDDKVNAPEVEGNRIAEVRAAG